MGDIGYDIQFKCVNPTVTPDIEVGVQWKIPGETLLSVTYNMTANNGTAMTWSAAADPSNYQLVLFSNSSQAEVVFDYNWI